MPDLVNGKKLKNKVFNPRKRKAGSIDIFTRVIYDFMIMCPV
jgi:hypothetical protein